MTLSEVVMDKGVLLEIESANLRCVSIDFGLVNGQAKLQENNCGQDRNANRHDRDPEGDLLMKPRERHQ